MTIERKHTWSQLMHIFQDDNEISFAIPRQGNKLIENRKKLNEKSIRLASSSIDR